MRKKKFLAMLLASTMLLGSTMTVFAAEGDNEQTVENMGNIMSKEVDVDSNFSVPIQDLSKIKITIPTNLDLNLLYSTGMYERDGIVKAEGELANNCVLTVALAPTLEYTLNSDPSVKLYADNDYHQVVSGLAYWKSDELAQEGGGSRSFKISKRAAQEDKAGIYSTLVDFNIKCHLVESADALSDYFTFGSTTINGNAVKTIKAVNNSNFNTYCAQNGGTMALPTFVLVDDVVYPVTSFSGLGSNSPGPSSLLSGVTSLVIPEGITEVTLCGTLGNCVSVTLPESLENIGKYAFMTIPNLTSIKIPDKVTTLGNSAFAYTGLTSFEAKNINSIDINCFFYCTALKTVNLGGTFYDIPLGCFKNCSNLEELTLPATVNRIIRRAYSNDPDPAFTNCTSLRTVNYGGNMLQFKNITNLNLLTDSSSGYNSGDLTVNCSDGTLHYTNGVLDE